MTRLDCIASTHIAGGTAWLTALCRYAAVIAPANLAWEIAHLPLYTSWRKGTWSEIPFAARHCTGGDVLIAGASLLGALLLVGSARWPDERYLAKGNSP